MDRNKMSGQEIIDFTKTKDTTYPSLNARWGNEITTCHFKPGEMLTAKLTDMAVVENELRVIRPVCNNAAT